MSFYESALGKGEFEGDPLSRQQRPKAAAGRARWRRRSFTGIDSRDEGFPPKDTLPPLRLPKCILLYDRNARILCLSP